LLAAVGPAAGRARLSGRAGWQEPVVVAARPPRRYCLLLSGRGYPGRLGSGLWLMAVRWASGWLRSRPARRFRAGPGSHTGSRSRMSAFGRREGRY